MPRLWLIRGARRARRIRMLIMLILVAITGLAVASLWWSPSGAAGLSASQGRPSVELAATYLPLHQPVAVDQLDTQLEDTSRSKDIPLRIYYPEPAGKYPVIIFSHGAGGSRDVAPALLMFWAEHGYVVIAPTHEDSIALRRKNGDKVTMQSTIKDFGTDPELRLSRVADDACIIDQLSELERQHPELAGKLDASRVGVGGHSAGAMTAMLIGGTREDMLANGRGGPEAVDLRDERVRAILVLSGQGMGTPGSCFNAQSWAGVDMPMFVMTGSLDGSTSTGQTPESRCDPYSYAPAGDKFLAFIAGAAHMSFTGKAAGQEGLGNGRLMNRLLGNDQAQAAQDYDQPQIFAYIKTASLAFWDAYMGGSPAAEAWLKSTAAGTWDDVKIDYEWK